MAIPMVSLFLGVFFLAILGAFPIPLGDVPAPLYEPIPSTEVSIETPVQKPEDTFRDTPPQVFEPARKRAVATVFWVGEEATSDNGYITNVESYWDEHWKGHFGGVDDPYLRCGYYPCTFTPKENPFYVALPYGEYESGVLKESAREVPWFQKDTLPLLKNRWVEVVRNATICYGQWQDVGPFETDDTDYVFGTSEKPKNMYLAQAGIDISPALRDCLSSGGIGVVEWRFVDRKDVPDGPWTDIETVSGSTWE